MITNISGTRYQSICAFFILLLFELVHDAFPYYFIMVVARELHFSRLCFLKAFFQGVIIIFTPVLPDIGEALCLASLMGDFGSLIFHFICNLQPIGSKHK